MKLMKNVNSYKRNVCNGVELSISEEENMHALYGSSLKNL